MPTDTSNIEALREHLAQLPLLGPGAAAPESVYRDLIGFVPPCLDTQPGDTLALRLRGVHEQMRLRALTPASIPTKTAHLMLLAMLLTTHGSHAVAQGMAARRAGASWDELRGVVHLVFMLQGLPGANRGDEFLAALAECERADRIAGAMAAYG